MVSIDRKSLIVSQEKVLEILRTAESVNSLKNTMSINNETVRTFAPLKQVDNYVILTDGDVKLILGKSEFKSLDKGEIIPTVDIKLNIKTQEITMVLHKWYL